MRLIFAILTTFALLTAAAWAEPVQTLLDELEQAETRSDADRLVAQIWQGWINAHTSEREQELMRFGMIEMDAGELRAAELTFSSLVETNPEFTEAWNKRATVRFLAGDLTGSEADVYEVLAREPRHFGAISGLGLIKMRLGEFEAALQAYELLLTVNPFSADALKLIPELRQRLGIADL